MADYPMMASSALLVIENIELPPRQHIEGVSLCQAILRAFSPANTAAPSAMVNITNDTRRWPLTKGAVHSFQRFAQATPLHSTIHRRHGISLGNAWQPTCPTP